MIYLDNAATTFPKPPRVISAVKHCLKRYCGNPGRGSHALSLAAAEHIYTCRELLCEYFGAPSPEHVIFTQNTTHALNIAIKGSLNAGDHVLMSELEHNAVRRPILALCKQGLITADTFPVWGLSGEEILQGIRQRVNPNTRAVICLHTSNICSVTLPIEKIGALCHQCGLLFAVDAAQSAGLLPIDMATMHISALAIPGHKSLYGIQGCGALLLGENAQPLPLIEGGSGVDSLSEEMPSDPPERYEAGTLPTPAIVGLAEGLLSVFEDGIEEIAERERALFYATQERLQALPGIKLYAPQEAGSVLLFNRLNTPAAETGRLLAKEGICVRAGLHCAPLAHQALHTPSGGAVRVSFGRYNTLAHIDALYKALK